MCISYEHMDADNIDYAWKEIRSFAESVLARSYPEDVKEPGQKPARKLSRQMSERFSFTQSVSRDDYNRRTSKGGLFDLATPLFVMKEFAEKMEEHIQSD
jgi:tyrosine decarboxylase